MINLNNNYINKINNMNDIKYINNYINIDNHTNNYINNNHNLTTKLNWCNG